MPSLNELMLGMLSKGAEQGSAGALAGQKQQSDLAAMLQGKQADRENMAAQISAGHAADLDSQSQAIARAKALSQQLSTGNPGHKYNVNVSKEGTAISEADQAIKPGYSLTPAQQEDEKKSADKIANWDTGGKEASQENINTSQDVLDELANHKRDQWDRVVGGGLKNWPTLQGIFASTEKSRADKVQNAATQMAKDSGVQIRNQQEFNAIMQRAYDPAASDEDNIKRVKVSIAKLKASQDAMNATSQRYHQTGYATIGDAPSAPATQRTQTKTVGGKTYVRTAQGWEEQ